MGISAPITEVPANTVTYIVLVFLLGMMSMPGEHVDREMIIDEMTELSYLPGGASISSILAEPSRAISVSGVPRFTAECVVAHRGKPVGRGGNTAWKRRRESLGLSQVPVHDLEQPYHHPLFCTGAGGTIGCSKQGMRDPVRHCL